jgi:hypothetical protein
MRYLVVLVFMILSHSALSQCNVFIPKKSFLHDSGYSIDFNLTSLFASKGYTEVSDINLAEHVLNIEGTELLGRFHRANSSFVMGPVVSIKSVICLTQFCSISDYAKAFNKAYKSFSQSLPTCL